jgi:diadenosine tetraphosphate (Ap4A) HIT family hydrolase
MACVFCDSSGGNILWRDQFCRVVHPNEADYPGLCRVIWNEHVGEMSDLQPAQRERCMQAVFALEQALRELLQPDKMNLASLGNAVPHLHWHVVPRYYDDHHFPAPIWGAPLREAAPRRLPAAFESDLRKRLARLG